MTGNAHNLVELTKKQQEQALARFERIRPYFEEGVSQAELARLHHVGLATLQRWVQRYRKEGLAGLARKERVDAGRSHDLPEELVHLIEGLYLSPPPPMIKSVYRKVCRVAKEQGWSEPSYDQVYRIVQRLPEALVTLAHEGTAGYREKHDLLYRWEATRANELWQADHCRLHLFVLNDRGTPVKPWLTIVLDDYSRCIAGYRLSLSGPSAAQTALALRGAIWRKEDERWLIQGVPETFYTDHGSDFTSNHLRMLAADLKMQVIFSEKGKPRGRGKIERFFRTVEQKLLTDLPGYAPKVDLGRRAESDAVAAPTAVLSLAEFDALFRKWLIEDYHVHLQEGIAEPPQQRWEAAHLVPVSPSSLAQLDVLLMTFPTRRRVQQDGIAFQGRRYFDCRLAEYVGEQVVVRYDPADLSEIAVYIPDPQVAQDSEYLRERLVCRARSQDLGGDRVTLKEVVETRRERRKALRQELRDRKKVVGKYASDKAEAKRWKKAAQGAITSEPAEKESVSRPEANAQQEERVERAEVQPRLKRFAHE